MTEPTSEEIQSYFDDPEFIVLPPGCGAPHPTLPDIFCGRNDTCIEFHRALVPQPDLSNEPITWPSDIKRPPKTASRKSITDIGDRVKPPSTAGSPRDVWTPRGTPDRDPPSWSKTDQASWLEAAKGAFRQFLLNRAETFTTPEDFWPTINSCREMRALGQVVQHGLRHQWIEEVASVRLRGTYYSLDRVPFKMNKLTPIYRSLLYKSAS